MPKLKVFRTSTGFHDAYVAAPSQKAALAAWGANGNLFLQGLAEQVSDEAVMAEPLAQPGVVIKKLRGTEAEHLAALGPMPDRAKARKKAEAAAGPASPAPPPAKAKAKPKPAPRPNRDALDAADAALARAMKAQKAARTSLEKQLKTLLEEQRRLEADQRSELTRLEDQAQRERDRYDAALERWRG